MSYGRHSAFPGLPSLSYYYKEMKEEKEENQMKKRAEEEEEDILEEEIIEIDLRGYQELSQLLKGEQRH